MIQEGPGCAVGSKVNLWAEIVSWSPCLVKHLIKIIIHHVDERRVTLCTGESACMLTGRRDMSTDIVFNDVKRKTTPTTSFKNSYQGAQTYFCDFIFQI